ncbi:MAG: radical SAM protein [Desulfuromonas sp.]|nr:MAG: radical SAM protein [Desulfuromonas sp.]
MKVALVFPPFFHASMYNLPPLGLVLLGTMLQRSGHQPVLLDQVLEVRKGHLPLSNEIYRHAAREILATRPDVVAFSAQCATYPPTLQIARLVKRESSGIRVIIGGHNATFVARQTLERHPYVDAVVRGEGEKTLPALIDAWQDGASGAGILGVTWRDGDQIVEEEDRGLIPDLADLPFPDYSLAPDLESYREACQLPRSIAILEVGRGCTHSCVYCSEAALWRRRCRTYPVPRLVKEMLMLRDTQGADCFLLAYDQFTADRRFVNEFCESMIEAGLQRQSWYCISRLDTVDRDLLRLMREAGCESMCYGIDSGSERTLAFIRKKIDVSILQQRVTETTEQGLVPTLSFVVGFPEEERSDVDATLELALMTGVRGNSNPLLQIPTVLPGTELHHRYLPDLVRQVDSYFALGIEFSGEGERLPEDEAMIDADPELFSSFYNLPCAGLELYELDLVANYFPLLINLFPKSFLLLCKALDESPSRLFEEFLDAADAAERSGPELTPQACYRHFPTFATERFYAESTWRHLPDVVRYETCCIEAARPGPPAATGNVDLSESANVGPQRRPSIVLDRFDFDLPFIVTDMQQGYFHDRYGRQESWLVFHQVGEQLEVSAINQFGHDLLDLCDGSVKLDAIVDALYRQYGSGMPCGEFAADCREAVATFEQMLLLQSSIS